jgi:hypothetical protein
MKAMSDSMVSCLIEFAYGLPTALPPKLPTRLPPKLPKRQLARPFVQNFFISSDNFGHTFRYVDKNNQQKTVAFWATVFVDWSIKASQNQNDGCSDSFVG